MAVASASTQGRVWPGAASGLLPDREFTFPETSALEGRPLSGVSWSGGGARAYGAALGQFEALDIGKFRYATGTSGGSWALSVYGYGNCSIGRSAAPEDLTPRELESNRGTAREFPMMGGGMFAHIFEYRDQVEQLQALGDLWSDVVFDTYLGPAGVARDAPLSAWTLNGTYPLFGFSIWGPVSQAPSEDNFRMLAASPDYVGAAPSFGTVGGLVEPQVFGCRDAKQKNLTLVGDLCPGFGIVDAVAASSWAIGALFSSVGGSIFNRVEGLTLPYYPIPLTTRYDAMFGDGGNVENEHVSGLVQRGLTRIVVFLNSDTPLDVDWNLSTTPASIDVICDDLPAFFGVGDFEASVTFNYTADHMFDTADFAPLVSALQDSVRRGDGGVATMLHTTVDNDRLGVRAGQIINVTWVYLSPSPVWFAALPNATLDLIKHDPIFLGFPHFSTSRLDLGLAEINALASLTTWVVERNAHHFVFE